MSSIIDVYSLGSVNNANFKFLFKIELADIIESISNDIL